MDSFLFPGQGTRPLNLESPWPSESADIFSAWGLYYREQWDEPFVGPFCFLVSQGIFILSKAVFVLCALLCCSMVWTDSLKIGLTPSTQHGRPNLPTLPWRVLRWMSLIPLFWISLSKLYVPEDRDKKHVKYHLGSVKWRITISSIFSLTKRSISLAGHCIFSQLFETVREYDMLYES